VFVLVLVLAVEGVFWPLQVLLNWSYCLIIGEIIEIIFIPRTG
jgi:hypothetical protein